MVRASKGALVGTLAVAIACVALPAWAEPAPSPDEIPLDDSHKATAQQLFLAGMDALDDGDLETACRDFAESQRLDPAIGTRFNLADCYEQRGQLASAWVNYVGVADAAERLGQMDRAQFARARADALQPRLSHLRIDVEEPVAGLRLTRDAVEVGRAQWSMRVPVDPGRHRLEATAPEHERWTTTVDVDEEGVTFDVRVPPLRPVVVQAPPPTVQPEPSPPPAVAPAPRDDEPRRLGPRHYTGFALAGVGLVGIGVGTGFGIRALRLNDDADAQCPMPRSCFPEGAQLLQDAERAGRISTATFIAGGVVLVTGIVLAATGHLPRQRSPQLSNRWSVPK